jgi:glycosyltransferase involved in cell wall biosynthesis
MDSTALVSVITATRNVAATLPACLESVRAQNAGPIEHLIIDAASTDATLDILKANQREGLRWISEPDRGIYDAWNKGLAMAQGKWIAFLGADDVYLPGAVQAYRELAARHPEAQYLSSRVAWGDAGRVIGQAWAWPRFGRFMCTAHVGSFHHRSLFEEYGKYDISLKIVGDYEFLLRPGRQLKAAYMPMITAKMAPGGASDSLAAVDEAARVKRDTAKRPGLLVELERRTAALGYRWRRRTAARS